MAVDPAFKAAGKKPGLEIFRIEKLKVVQITDTSKFGKFHTGDSYIVLSTEKNNNALKWDIHFWLGTETSQDEAGVAAYKTVELDDSLGGAPVQHREVQGNESQQFQTYFKSYGGLRYLEGGVESGFKKVDRDAHEKRLLHVKGKRNVRVTQVKFSSDSLNRGDVFILDGDKKIYQWNGKESSRAERAKALDVVKQIKDDERGGKVGVVIIEDGQDDDTEFFQELGGKGKIKDAQNDDEEFERKKAASLKLYRVSDSSGQLKVSETGTGILKKELLDSNDAFILDTSQSLFVWIGKKATKEEKNGAWTLALKFIQEKGYPVSTPCTRVIEGGETSLFIQQFAVWPKPEASTNYTGSKIAKVAKKDVDVSKLHLKEKPEKQKVVDDGSGKLQIWRIENLEKVPVDPKEYGKFYQGDSYILLYTYLDALKKEAYIIYFWQGLDSSQDEKAASAILATKLDDEYGGTPVQVRVVQNKEPEHFLTLFKGKFIIRKGGKASGFRNSTEKDNEKQGGTTLFRIHGTNHLNTKAVEVDLAAASLNSNDCYVLNSPKITYAWFGKFATGDEREVARTVAGTLTSPTQVEAISEGAEKNDFWTLLGGKADYPTNKLEAVPEFEPRLFQISNASGNLDAEEIFDFTQEDLISDDVMLLDSWNEIFLWIGSGANTEEKKGAMELALKYLKTAPGNRSSETTPVLLVKQGFEPPLFTCHFIWDHAKATSGVADYEKLKQQLVSGVVSAADELKKYSQTYPYDELLKRPLPDGVDASKLENHLNAEDFPKAFGCSQSEFLAFPKWKKDDKKKAARLF